MHSVCPWGFIYTYGGYRMYLKCLAKLQEREFCTSKERKQASKKKVQINICPEMSGLESNWKITFNDKYIDCVTFRLQLTWYSHSTRSQFSNCWVLIVYQVTAHNKCSKCPPSGPIHAWTRMIVDCRTLSKVPGRLWMVWEANKMRCWSVSAFAVGAVNIRCYKCLQR
jgi:hypothetical protein